MLVASGAEAGGHRVAFLEPPERGLIGLFALLPQVVDNLTPTGQLPEGGDLLAQGLDMLKKGGLFG